MGNKKALGLYLFLIWILGITITACSTDTKQPQTLSAQEIEILGKTCEDIAKLQIETWDNRDAENLREIYTEDIVHFDNNPAFVGIDEVIGMAEMMFRNFHRWQMELGDTYISKEKCVGTWVSWDVLGLTQDNPGLEFDLLETRDNKISFWRLFYDENYNFAPIDYEFLYQFEQSWSQNDENALLEIYSENAKVEDTLYGVTIVGHKKIADYAKSIFALSQGASWKLIIPFTEGEAEYPYKEEYPFPSKGGVFSIGAKKPDGNACEIRIVVILTPDENGKIQAQETFYNVNTLIECGWAK
jgi:hypothetical protein